MQYGEWIGRTALALVFLFNALGVVDQTRAATELAAHGAPAALVPPLMVAGRVLQLFAGVALVIAWHERLPRYFLHSFSSRRLVRPHDFRAAKGPELQGQLVNFLKSVAIFGGLCVLAFRARTVSSRRSSNASAEGRVMRTPSADSTASSA